MATMVKAGDSKAFTYDIENRLIDVKKNGTTVGQYFYDGDGGRTAKINYASGVAGNNTCFLAGTKVLMDDGRWTNIEDIKVGDRVASYDEKKMAKTSVKVTEMFDGETAKEYLLVNGNLKVTPNHQFYSQGKWIEIGKLKVGDILLDDDLKEFAIESIEKITAQNSVQVYNIEVEGDHNYFVASSVAATPTVTPAFNVIPAKAGIQLRGILVHNKLSYNPPAVAGVSVTSGVITHYVGSLYETTKGVAVNHIFMGSTKIATISNDQVRYSFQDHLGSANVVTNSSGSLIELIEYKPFGEFSRREMYGTPNAAWNYFTGQKLDDETGLMYYGARYYSPLIGRFITPDTIVQGPMNPQTLNRYSYCGNNPVSFTDPDGHWFWFAVAIIAGGVTGGVSAYQSGGNILAGIFLGAATTAVTAGAGAWVGAAIKAGTMSVQAGMAAMAAVGATTGAVNSAITGGNIGYGALMGGLSSGIGIGSAAAFTSNFTKNAFAGGLAAALFSGAVVNATGAAIAGGNIGQAALTGAVQNGTYFVAGYGAAKAYGKFQETRANAAASQSRLTVGEAETVVQQQALSEDLGPRTVKLDPKLFPQSADEMDSYLGFKGTRIQDTSSTPGRGKVVWNASDHVKITFEKHPYHVNAPDYHKGSHWHVDTPSDSHQRFLPGDKIPGRTYSIGGGNE